MNTYLLFFFDGSTSADFIQLKGSYPDDDKAIVDAKKLFRSSRYLCFRKFILYRINSGSSIRSIISIGDR